MDKLRTSLGGRLTCVASFIKKGERIADIGTDHAYLPVFLVTNGICPSAIASDIGEGPLKNAEKIVNKTETKDKIRLMISDGLDSYGKDDADVFIFAGMGGTLIVNLLAKTPWIKDKNLRFVFQPMSRSEELIEYLTGNDFEITKESACFDGGRCYIVFSAVYSGNKKDYPESFPYLGLLPQVKTEASQFYIDRQYKLIVKRAKALEKADVSPAEQEKLRTIIGQMKQYVSHE